VSARTPSSLSVQNAAQRRTRACHTHDKRIHGARPEENRMVSCVGARPVRKAYRGRRSGADRSCR
jgi:hypothetical protein